MRGTERKQTRQLPSSELHRYITELPLATYLLPIEFLRFYNPS